ncbi:hypothetical protein Hanom_Chr08g00689251 [Helianthus anomalus]
MDPRGLTIVLVVLSVISGLVEIVGQLSARADCCHICVLVYLFVSCAIVNRGA